MPDVIRQTLIARSPDGTRREVIVRVAVPIEDRGLFRCEVELIGIDHRPARIVGEDAMQSLYLGLRFIRLQLAAQEEDHGVRYFRPNEPEEPFAWQQAWYAPPTT